MKDDSTSDFLFIRGGKKNMRKTTNTLDILLSERDDLAPSIPPDLVERIYKIEERVQFDEARVEAARRVREAVEIALEKQYSQEG